VITTVGVLLDALGHGRQYELHGRMQAWSSSALELRQQQPPTIPLNVHHRRELTIGEIVSLYRDVDGRAWAVGLADDVDGLLKVDQPLYYSAETSCRPDGTDIVIEGCALTTQPAQLGLTPLMLLAGDLSSPNDRARWVHPQVSAKMRERLEEAAEEMRGRAKRPISPILVHDPLPALPPLSQRMDDSWRDLGGGFQKSAHVGRVLSVR